MSEWNPAQYLKFKNERTQPSHDLLARIGLETPKRVLDVGCGPGNSTALLAARWPKAEVVGIDNSADMIRKASREHPGLRWQERDASKDLSDLGLFDVVFSNAALQWIPDHDSLVPRLFGLTSPGGVLAAQVPNNEASPLHSAVREVALSPSWSRYFTTVEFQVTASAPDYYDRLTPLTPAFDIWLTTYIHIMDSHEGYIEWSRGTYMRSFLNQLPAEEDKAAFTLDVLERVIAAYQPQKNGKFLFPFQRLFFTALKTD